MSTLNGELVYIFLIAILDAAILSWVALRWYRRAVARRMAIGRGPMPPSTDSPASHAVDLTEGAGATDSPLRVAVFRTDSADHRRQWPARWQRIVLAYCVGAGLFSAVVTAAAAVQLDSPRLSQVFGLWWINAWPIVPTLIVLLLLDRRSAARVVAAYLLGGSALLAILTFAGQLLRWSFSSAPITNVVLLNLAILVTAGPALIVLIASSWQRIRAVMPLALASTLSFGFGLLLFRRAVTLAFNIPVMRDVLLQLAAVTSTQVAYYSLYMLLALPAGWVAWRLLKALAGAFERKRFSDIQLVVDCWWAIVTAEVIATSLVAPFGLAGIGIGLAAFAAYRAGTFATLRLTRNESSSGAKRLLLLRVFGYQARTEWLFDRIAQRWRFLGPVQLFAGVDLAMRTADPGDMLAFVSGHLPDVHVTTADDLTARIERLDMNRDPDGRFRVNDLCCAHQIWQDALRRLLSVSDVVVMDLRGFTKENSGCVYELEQLATHLPPEAIVLVCDKTTDLKALALLLNEAWTRAERGTRRDQPQTLALVPIERNSPGEIDTLMERLLGHGASSQVVNVASLATLS